MEFAVSQNRETTNPINRVRRGRQGHNSSLYEQQFLDALKDIFIGAKVEGASGYINLMVRPPQGDIETIDGPGGVGKAEAGLM